MAYLVETVTGVHHWNDTLFSFKTTRSPSFNFKNGQFVVIGLEINGKKVVRAYSVASANHEDYLEFFSIKVPDGALTSHLQHLKVGDKVFVSDRCSGTLINSFLLSGKRLWLLSTGTGLAPFMSLIKDPDIYEQFEQVVLVHGVRHISDLAYQDYILHDLPKMPYLGEIIAQKLVYYPTVTRESYKHEGRLTELLTSGKLNDDLNLPPLNVADDRFMICGGHSMLLDTCDILQNLGFKEGTPEQAQHYVIERAFVEK